MQILICLISLVIVASEKAPEIKITVNGALESDWQSPNYKVEADKRVWVECTVQGALFQHEDIRAFVYDVRGQTELDIRKGQLGQNRSSSKEFRWTPRFNHESGDNMTKLKCESRTRQNNTDKGDMLSEDFVDVDVVYAPQELEDLFLPVEKVGSSVVARLNISANPHVDTNSVVWELAGNILQRVTLNSHIPGYSLTLESTIRGRNDLVLTIDSIKQEDLGVHSISLSNSVGKQTYKVRYFVPEGAEVFIGKVKSELLAYSENKVVCRSTGGNPPPILEARIEVEISGKGEKDSRKLDLIVDDDGSQPGQQRRTFLLNPTVAERTDNGTFVVCEGIQKVGGKQVFKDREAHTQIRIVYPPQAQPEKYVYTTVGERAELRLKIEAFPAPEENAVFWDLVSLNINPNVEKKHNMKVEQLSSSLIRVILSVENVQEEDFDTRYTVKVTNEHGAQEYNFMIVKPMPTWVWVLIGLGVLALIGSCCVCAVCTKRKNGKDQNAEAGNGETRSPFLAESST